MTEIETIRPLVNKMTAAADLLSIYVEGPRFQDCRNGTGFDGHLPPAHFLREIAWMSRELSSAADEMLNMLNPPDESVDAKDLRSRLIFSQVRTECEQIKSNIFSALDEVRKQCVIPPAGKVAPDVWSHYRESFEGDIFLDQSDPEEPLEYTGEFVIWIGQLQKAALDRLKRAADHVSEIKKWVNLTLHSENIIPPPQLKWAELSELEQKVIAQLSVDPGSLKSSGQLADDLKCKVSQIHSVVRKNRELTRSGLIEKILGRKGGLRITEAGLSLYNERQRLT